MKRLTIAALSLVLFSQASSAQTPGPVQPPSTAGSAVTGVKSVDLRRQSFEIVWQTVKDKHFDPTFGGVDWDRVRQQYEPRVAKATNDQDFYRLLQQMLEELRQSHFNIIPPEALLSGEDQEMPIGAIGIDLRMIGGAAVLTRVDPGSPAARAGLKTGYVIKQINGKPVEHLVEKIDKSKESAIRKDLRKSRRLLAEIGGEPGTEVTLVRLEGNNRAATLPVTRERLKGELSPRFGNFPPQYTEFESKRLPGNIGYIRFNIFTVPVIEKVRSAVREFNDASGLIFDLRGNPGGLGGMAPGIAGLLTNKQGSLGTMKMRSGHMNFAYFPQANPYLGPVAVLIDGASASTSEIFAGGLQETGRAVIVGERSLGAALPSYFQKLPTGALFQFAIADYKTPSGVLIEGRGVNPDLVVKYDRSSLLSGKDAQLDAAIVKLREKIESR